VSIGRSRSDQGDPDPGARVLTLLMFAVLAIPSQLIHAIETNRPIEPEELLARQLGGVTQEEIRAEVNTRRSRIGSRRVQHWRTGCVRKDG
jgi:hypothetical protein